MTDGTPYSLAGRGFCDRRLTAGVSGQCPDRHPAEFRQWPGTGRAIARLQMRFVAVLGPAFFATAVTLYHYITATTFIGIGFGVGFVGGFVVGSSVRRDYDNSGVTKDLVDFFAS